MAKINFALMLMIAFIMERIHQIQTHFSRDSRLEEGLLPAVGDPGGTRLVVGGTPLEDVDGERIAANLSRAGESGVDCGSCTVILWRISWRWVS